MDNSSLRGEGQLQGSHETHLLPLGQQGDDVVEEADQRGEVGDEQGSPGLLDSSLLSELLLECLTAQRILWGGRGEGEVVARLEVLRVTVLLADPLVLEVQLELRGDP